MSVRAPVGPVSCNRTDLHRARARRNSIAGELLEVLFFLLRSLEPKITGSAGAAFASINKGDIEQIQIPLPPLDVQQEIVAEIEGYQRVIDGARAVVDNYRPHIEVDPAWPMVALGEVCGRIKHGGRRSPQQNMELEARRTLYRNFEKNINVVAGKSTDLSGGDVRMYPKQTTGHLFMLGCPVRGRCSICQRRVLMRV